jgi:hypothetical protein
VVVNGFAHRPFALSLSKGCRSCRPKEVQGFDKLSPNGFSYV